MTLEELKALEHSYEEDVQLMDFQDRIPDYKDRDSNKALIFWGEILDNIKDENLRQLIYAVFSEYIYFYENLKGVEESAEEINEAYQDERLFIFPFKPGDFIQRGYGDPERIMSVTMTESYTWPVINTETRRVVQIQDVRVEEKIIEYPELVKYKKVDDIEEYCLVNEYGEGIDYYWE